ncbi:HAD family hydrolase [Liquorilactobacillus hordei]|uniref:HAD family hydrolase n=1 Tax=Liquorilactobacillus hordei TaxID=468911 RepID=UPI0015E7F2E5|nr:HAD family phosphatase [Liquorilactobacillus hordei]
MTKAVIFDLDGLLIDSEVISLMMYQQMVHEYGHKMTKKMYTQNYSGRSAAQNMYSLINNFDLPLTFEEGIMKSQKIEKKLLKNGISLKESALELLQFLRKNDYRIALASSSTPERAIRILKTTHIDCYFDCLTFANEVTNGKPSPEIFIKTSIKLQQPLSECLILEDSEAGIQAAYSAKISVICVPDIKYPRPCYAKMTKKIYSSLKDIIIYLKINKKIK